MPTGKRGKEKEETVSHVPSSEVNAEVVVAKDDTPLPKVSLNSDVKLKTTENAWKPASKKSEDGAKDEEELKLEDVSII